MIFFALALIALAAFLVLTQRDKHPNLQQMGRYFRVASFILLALGSVSYTHLTLQTSDLV